MSPPDASPAPGIRESFATALRALWRDARVHLGFAAVFLVVSVLSCCVFVFVALASDLGDSAPNASDGHDASRGLQLATRSFTVVFAIVAAAYHRAFTTGVVLAALRGTDVRGTDEARAAVARWPAQVGVGVVRVLVEIVPPIVPFALMVSSGVLRHTSVAAGLRIDPRVATQLVYASVALAYAAWSTLVRPLLGPTSAVVQAEPVGLLVAFRRSATLVQGRRGAAMRLRASFATLAYGLLATTLLPGAMFFASVPAGEVTQRTNVVVGVLVLGGVLLFYPVAYALFLLDAALDAAFYVHAAATSGSDDVAKVFA